MLGWKVVLAARVVAIVRSAGSMELVSHLVVC